MKKILTFWHFFTKVSPKLTCFWHFFTKVELFVWKMRKKIHFFPFLTQICKIFSIFIQFLSFYKRHWDKRSTFWDSFTKVLTKSSNFLAFFTKVMTKSSNFSAFFTLVWRKIDFFTFIFTKNNLFLLKYEKKVTVFDILG